MTTNYTPSTAPFILNGLHQAIADTEDMFARLDFTLAQVRGALAIVPMCDTDFDTGFSDQHIYTPEEQWEAEAGPIADLELSMLDTCLGAPHSDGEAGCILIELESRGILVEPILCGWCGRTHLVKVGR